VAATGQGAPDLGAPTTFVLLRHGETPLTGQQRFSGSGGSDPGLSARGRAQAELAARELAAQEPGSREPGGPGSVQAVVSSPLARCRQTAAAAADRLGLDVTVEEGLRETDFGAWDGLLAAHRGRTVLLVSHVTPIKTLIRLALGAPPEALFRMRLDPAALSAVDHYADGNTSVRYVNATAHLRELPGRG
jgi:probable phosphoglycerate mutase